jgi:hypothetical protein
MDWTHACLVDIKISGDIHRSVSPRPSFSIHAESDLQSFTIRTPSKNFCMDSGLFEGRQNRAFQSDIRFIRRDIEWPGITVGRTE